jgi:hypothetical protein
MNKPDLLDRFRKVFGAEVHNSDPGEDVFVVLSTRKRRRLAEAAARRDRKKGQRAWTQREMVRERMAADLANQFAIVDGTIPARPEVKRRVQEQLARKIATVMANSTEEIDAAEAEQRLRQLTVELAPR